MKICLLGASGFVGSRLVEKCLLGGLAEVRPVARGFGSLARLARFDLDWRLADITDENALAAAFDGCDFVVHSAFGQFDMIEGSIPPVYQAANRAGVRRMIYLSTASVHGQSPAPGTTENSPLSDRQAQEYNNCKVRSEWRLQRERDKGKTETVILRPGIVFGPRDRWASDLAAALRTRTAYLVGDGSGVCNSVYVDNLVDAIYRAITATNVDREAFFVLDAETVTWGEFYHRIAEGLGYPPSRIRHVPQPVFRRSFGERLDGVRGMAAVQALLPFVSARLKRVAKASLSAWPEKPVLSPWVSPGLPNPAPTREMADLHLCHTRLPEARMTQVLGFKPQVAFSEGCRRTVEWIRFAGY